MTTQDRFQTDAVTTRLLHSPLSLAPGKDHGLGHAAARIMHPRGFTGATVRHRGGEYYVDVHGEPWGHYEDTGRDGHLRRDVWPTRLDAVGAVVERRGLTTGPITKPKAKPKAGPRTWQHAVDRLGNRSRLKLANNTYLERRGPDAIAVKLHATDIVTYYRDGTTEVYTGGWFTSTTAERINGATPHHLYVSGKCDTRRTKYPADTWTLSNKTTGRSVTFRRRETGIIGPRGGLRVR